MKRTKNKKKFQSHGYMNAQERSVIRKQKVVGDDNRKSLFTTNLIKEDIDINIHTNTIYKEYSKL